MRPISPENPMAKTLDIRRSKNKPASWFKNAQAFSNQGNRIVDVFYDVIRGNHVKRIVRKSDGFQTTKMNGQPICQTRIFNGSSIDLQTFH